MLGGGGVQTCWGCTNEVGGVRTPPQIRQWCTREALMGTKVRTVFFIDTLGTLVPKVHKRCTKRCTRGASINLPKTHI